MTDATQYDSWTHWKRRLLPAHECDEARAVKPASIECILVDTREQVPEDGRYAKVLVE